MLNNLHVMLVDQGFHSIRLFSHDQIELEKLQNFESIAKEKKIFQVTSPRSIQIPDPALYSAQAALLKKKRAALLREHFFPPFCITKICIVGHAEHSKGGNLVVVFCGFEEMESGKLGKNILEDIVRQTEQASIPITHIMFLHSGDVTPHAKDFIRVGHPLFKFQLFSVDVLRQNLKSYHLMPEIKVMDDSKIKKDPNLTPQCFPKLWNSDRLARYLNAQPKTFIGFARNSINGHYQNVRVVIEETKEKKVANKVHKKEK